METKKLSKQYGGLDVFRLIAALLVISIHISPLEQISSTADFILCRILARVAVPFFFMVTGYFVMPKFLFLDRRGVKPWNGLYKAIAKTLYLYLFAVLLFIPIGIYAGHYKDINICLAIQMLFFDGTFYHLWYFPAILLGITFLALLSHRIGFEKIRMLSILLYIIGLFGDSYYGFISRTPIISDAYGIGFQVFSYTRNGLLFAPLFLVMGADISRKPVKNATVKTWGLFAGSLGVMITEGLLLHKYDMQRHDSMYLLLPFCMYFLFDGIRSIRIMSKPRLRVVSTWVYILHPLVIVLLRGFAKVVGITKIITDNVLIQFCAVSILTFLISYAISYLPTAHRKSYNKNKGIIFREEKSRAWISLNREALKTNVEVFKELLPKDCELMPAVKANAYGLGDEIIAHELNKLGVRSFCVASVTEAVALRKKGISGDILILGYTSPEQFYLLRRYKLTQTVIDYEYAKLLNGYGHRMNVHVALDTGMHRLGERCENRDLLVKIFQMKYLHITGIFSHLCVDDSDKSRDCEYTCKQAEMFYKTVEYLEQQGFDCGKKHILNSYGIFKYPQLGGDYARVGIALYGVLSTKEDSEKFGNSLEPIFSLKSRVTSVKELKKGESAGYGLDFTAEKDCRIAVLSIGYADGLPRGLSNKKGSVLIAGERVSIVGRVCMDQTLVDVTELSGLHSGDVAVIIGTSGAEEITVGDVARETGTIANEVLSRLGPRLERLAE